MLSPLFICFFLFCHLFRYLIKYFHCHEDIIVRFMANIQQNLLHYQLNLFNKKLIQDNPHQKLKKQLCQQINNLTNKLYTPNLYQQTHIKLTQQQLNSFKTQPCLQHPTHNQLTQYYYNCKYYHTKNDHRRQPYPNTTDTKNLLYTELYLQDDFNNDICLNWIQYNFHPNIYKTKICQIKPCQFLYCPKIHQGQQKQQIPIVQISKNTYIIKIQSTINQIKQLKTISNIDECQNQILKQQLIQVQLKIKKYFNVLVENQKFYKQQLYKEKQEIQQQEIITNIDQITKQKEKKQAKNRTTTLSPKQHQQNYTTLNYKQKLNIVQDDQHELKPFSSQNATKMVKLILPDICAFANSNGGFIYLGINHQSIVSGIDQPTTWFTQFKTLIDSHCKNTLQPPLTPQHYTIQAIPLTNTQKSIVVQIQVRPPIQSQQKIPILYQNKQYRRNNKKTEILEKELPAEEFRQLKEDFHRIWKKTWKLSCNQIDQLNQFAKQIKSEQNSRS